MKKLKAVLLGAGNRGCVYADYSLTRPEELEIISVIEPNPVNREYAKTRYGIEDKMVFEDLDDFLKTKTDCDFVINGTMDQMHYQTAIKVIDAGYNMLLEKPITNNEEQLLDIERRANEKNVKVCICHVLRYTPFYKKIKELINNGKIGKIMTIELSEHVWIAHFVDSFVRGKWGKESECGSGFLLSKSCHDTDLFCWLNNSTKPVKVSSFGSRSLFSKANMPDGATEFCYNCPHNSTCLYSAQKIHLEQDLMPFQTWAHLGKPFETVTYEEKEEDLKKSEYGKCVFTNGGDITDRQSVTVEFENGSLISFTMIGGSSKAGRFIHIIGTHGEIEGHLEEGKFILREFDRSDKKFGYNEKEFNVNKDVVASENYAGHSGGDFAIMNELVRYLQGDNSSVSITSINDSINGHRVVFAAEKSRKTGEIVVL